MASKYGNRYIWAEDIRQELYLLFLQFPDGTPTLLKWTIAKRCLCDIFKSKRYQYSYGNKFRHYRFGFLYNPALTEKENESFTKALTTDNPEDDYCIDIDVEAAMTFLTGREQKVLSLYFMEGKTEECIAEQIGVGRSAVSKIKLLALSKLEEVLNA